MTTPGPHGEDPATNPEAPDAAYPPPGYQPPGYAPPPYPPPGYEQPGYQQPGFQPPPYQPPPYQPPPYQPPPYQPPPYQPPGYQPPGYQPPGYQPPGYQPPGYQPPGYGNAPGYYAALAPKPGLIPLRPLSLSDILDGSFRLIRRNPRATLGLSAAVAVIQVGIVAIYQLLAGAVNTGLGGLDSSASDSSDGGSVVAALGGGLLSLAVTLVFGAILTGLLTVVVTDDVLGRRVDLSDAWARVRPKLAGLVGLSLVVSLLEGIGLVLCIAPGVWLWGIWALAVPAYIVEKESVFGSMGRSRRLVEGAFWRVWGIRALGWLIVAVVTGIIQAPFSIGATLASGGFGADDPNLTVYVLISSVGTIIATMFVAPVRAGIDALLYVDQRMRKEGLDIVLQQAAAHPGA